MNKKVIVIDDEKMILDLTAMVLQHRGYEVFTADNALDGYEIIRREQPAIALLDYMMPRVNGLTALREIRQRFPSTYVIMFTGKGSEEIAVELMKAGAADYILKPFSNANLVDRIDAILRLRSIELRNRELLEEREKLLEEIAEWNRELERRVAEKSLELERAHAEILQNEKLAALGHLSAGMAHEIRNPLNSIGLFAQILRSGVEHDPEMVSYTAKIINEVERIDDILVRLLATSRRSPFQLRSIHVQEVIRQVVASFEEQARLQQVELVTEQVGEPPAILADGDELAQIFTNLIANALFEMRDGGVLEIRLEHADRLLTVTVGDTGKGIPPENLTKIFDPFFTTKEKGTGFGLSVVLRIVKTYGGRIRAENRPGGGTRFVIDIPLG
ncbi:MAG: response regulator [Deltaproteobacteria bacterium]|nr:MAG: response regulator [Deltaproteobacteria bacterium]